MDSNRMNDIYRNVPLEEIPWVRTTPPALLVQLIENGKLKPCRVIDIGCGVGNYSIYLASKGFQVTGIDISKRAVEIARENAKKCIDVNACKNAEMSVDVKSSENEEKNDTCCDFMVMDMLGDMSGIRDPFDLVLEWQVLHLIFPENRERYVKNVHSILKTGGRYLSVCFSEKNTKFGGCGKFRETELGTRLYFSSEDELTELFDPYFQIIELKTTKIEGRRGPNDVVFALMEK